MQGIIRINRGRINEKNDFLLIELHIKPGVKLKLSKTQLKIEIKLHPDIEKI